MQEETPDFYSSVIPSFVSTVTTELKNDYKTWIMGRGASDPFVIKGLVRYREEKEILYPPLLYSDDLSKVTWILIDLNFEGSSDQLTLSGLKL